VTAANGRRLLIECGDAWDKIQKALDFKLAGIHSCLLSHEHKDHSKSVKDVIDAGIHVVCSSATAAEVGIRPTLAETKKWKIQESQEQFKMVHTVKAGDLITLTDTFIVRAMSMVHDAVDPLGYRVVDTSSGDSLFFATDTSYLHLRKDPFPPQNIIAIECNYDEKILRERVHSGEVNPHLAMRLLTSHMCKRVCLRYLKYSFDLSGCREIHLLHMSASNIDREATRREFEEQLFTKVITIQ